MEARSAIDCNNVLRTKGEAPLLKSNHITTASFTFARRDVKDARAFLQPLLARGVVYTERRKLLKREFIVTGPAEVIGHLQAALHEIQNELRIRRS
jgi:hypothetical protein